ncbi:gluconokinase [Maribacter sp. MAR_2009_72]|uniref:gluconokinase n=1 Tax=Maribacter sp. MAR_2009_72 TaxID=1250050 RepID=UPI001199C43D|nr:gluconokinase [Maribacter sp. MAR_2009_72]TVZ14446.1 gluconokinase [Maribacter sp. MAR_2009_72]
MNNPQILFVMGVSGSGKTTIGTLLAQKLNIPFFDGDDFHPASNIKKMSVGIPLNDDDRQGWLERLNKLALEHTTTGAVIVCSALKEKYRVILGNQLEGLHKIVYLEGSYELINDRLIQRKNHFMPKGLLRSQFDTLEIPHDAITVSIDQSPEAIVADIIKML